MTLPQRKPGVYHLPLNHKDTATQTEGCRHTNPDICASHSMQNVCAFVRTDGMCQKPPARWRKQFEQLMKAKKEGTSK